MTAVDTTNKFQTLLGRSALAAILGLAAAVSFSCGEEAPPSWNAPAECNLPFDPGSCFLSVDVWSYEAGMCRRRIYGGCEGNANNFKTQEECMAHCEGRPSQRPCTEGRLDRPVCMACAATGGCGRTLQLCAKPCTSNADCAGSMGFSACANGICQIPGCL